jgi:ornithine decarboxylase
VAEPDTPYLVLDLDTVHANYLAVRGAMPPVAVYYAVKANPAPEIVRLLASLGAGFDVASPGEVELCLAQGATPDRLSYGNTIKKAADIRGAYRLGVRRFSFDAAADLANLGALAPGSVAACRFLVDAAPSGTPFGRKFGCSAAEAVRLLSRACELGLRPALCFHVGSQQCDPRAWAVGIATAGWIAETLSAQGIRLDSVNLGGGFPVSYRDPVPSLGEISAVITDAVASRFGADCPPLLMEPGRAIVASAGVIRASVVSVAERPERWVYLDVGRYNGLAETENEYIAYRLTTDRPSDPDGPVIIAGPTCDGDDVLYQHTEYRLPLALAAGDRVEIHDAGAYTASYSSVSFNGIPPLPTHFTSPEVGSFTGRHVLAELHGVAAELLDDEVFLAQALERALIRCGATVCEVTAKRFHPQGVTVLAMLAESHASVHTYPERGSVFLDVFTCGRRADPNAAVRMFSESLGASRVNVQTVHRGQS